MSIKWELCGCRPGLGIVTDIGESLARVCLSLPALWGTSCLGTQGQRDAIPAIILGSEGQAPGQQSRWKPLFGPLGD